MIPVPRKAWARTTSPKAQELAPISQRPAFLRPGAARRAVIGNCRSPVSGDESPVDAMPLAPGFRSRRPSSATALRAERRLVERDLVGAAQPVGDALPGLGDVVGPGLGVEPAGEHLGQLVLGDAVILEDAGDARLDRAVRGVVGAELGLEVRADVFPRIAGADPLVDVGM